MLLILCLLAAATAAPAIYDQRQQGDFNVQADVQNVMLLVLLPQKKLDIPFGAADLLGDLLSSKKSKNPEMQDRADIQVLEAFVKPSAPYKVEIGASDERSAGVGARQEVVIAARRRPLTVEAQADEELKLLGATEQCGPGRRRDPETLMCQDDPEFEQSLIEQPEESPIKSTPAAKPASLPAPLKPVPAAAPGAKTSAAAAPQVISV